MTFIDFVKQAYARFHSPTPAFWKSVQRKFARLAVLFVVFGGIYQDAPAGYLPEWVLTWITYGGIACGAVVAVAQFACDDRITTIPPKD